MLNIGTTPDGTPVRIKPDHLTNHGFIVGMTGSGKTGLAVGLLEELALAGIPALILDPKGDLPNLCLLFPDLRPEDFAPWTPDAGAAAARWREGLAAGGVDAAGLAALLGAVDRRIVTPGSSVSPVNFLPSLKAPAAADLEEDLEGVRDRIRSVVGALLQLLGIAADPFTDPRHIFLSLLMEHFFKAGKDASLGDLILNLENPPFTTLGVLPLETAFPVDQRRKLVFALNALLSSPGFASWFDGPPLDMEDWLWAPGGRPRHTIVVLNHLSEEMKGFALTLILAELKAYVRRQAGSSALKWLLYWDEISGFLPPAPANPPTKGPILSLLKTARAFGLGIVLATQNTVDADYKALANMGTWFVGRLHTDQDKRRIADVLGAERGVQEAISSLAARSFWFRSFASSEPPLILRSRHARAFLKGPMTLQELKGLASPGRPAGAPPPPAEHTAPVIVAKAPVLHTPSPGEKGLHVLAKTRVIPRDTTPRGTAAPRESTAFFLLPATPRGAEWIRLEAPPSLDPGPAPSSTYTLPPNFAADPFLREAREALEFVAPRLLAVKVLANREAKLWSAPGEERDAFVRRCAEALGDQRRREEETVRKRLEQRIERIREQKERETQRKQAEQEELRLKEQQSSINILEAGLGALFGGRKLATKLKRAATGLSRAGTRRRQVLASETQIRASEQKIGYLEEQLRDLRAEMDAEARRIEAKYAGMADAVEEETVAPERRDLRIEQLSLVWMGANEVH